MFPVTKCRQYVNRRALQTSNVSGETSKRAGNLPDLDSDATMKVCRVCLAMCVKMYRISEQKMSVMYERVTGIQIKAEDKLPKMLCWECVARLSSAYNFIEKNLKTHQILVAKVNSSKFITLSDIESIDRAQYQLESTLGVNICKENDSRFYIINESDTSNDHYNIQYHNYYEDNDIVIKSEEIRNSNTEVNIYDEVNPIKSQYLDKTEEQKVVDENYKATNISDEKDETKSYELVIVKQEYIHDEEQAVDNFINVSVQLEDQSSNDNGSVCDPLIKKEIDFMDSTTLNVDSIKEEQYMKFGCEDINVRDSDITSDSTSTDYSKIHITQIGTDSSKKLFSCDICGRKYCFKRNLIEHIKTHSVSILYKCTLCNYETYHKRYLTAHINRMHPKKGTFSCKYCKFKTFLKKSLNTHINRKHTDLYNCDYCSHVTNKKSSLMEHINAKHTKQNVYICSQCGFKTYIKLSLEAHINVKHINKNIYNCPYCYFKTYNKGYIKSHINSQHNKTTSFNCSFCSYSSHDNSNLSRHVNSKHPSTNV